MKKNNYVNGFARIFTYFVLIASVFVLGNVVARVTNAQILPSGTTFNPSDPAALEKNPPIEIYGVTCGRADSNQNKCCKNEALINLDPQQIADQGIELGNKILNASGSAQLSSTDLSLIDQAIEASSMDSAVVLAKVDDVLDRLVNGPSLPSQDERNLVAAIVADGFKHLVDTTENTGPAKLMARQMFTPDKCLIKTRFVKFCFRGIMEFFAGVADSTGLTGGLKEAYKQTKFTECEYGVPSGSSSDPSCTCKNPDGVAAICRRYITNSEVSRCDDCITNKGGFWTGLGCIGTDPGSFAQSLIGYGLSIGGAFSILCIFYAAFVLQTSRGNPENIKKAKENLRACITGLILIIFSVLIVRVVGVDLLRIPGFN
jgi:hypothetical protein